ncbi:MAG TPA: PxxKW family cysteine-rich protein [Bacteroidales bacterium]|nr:PxxKW family cysteine-rich protein [Bacteroidales bacterium]
MMEKKPIIEKCIGCKKVTEDNFCMVYVNPEGRWSLGGCGISTHIPKTTAFVAAKMMNLLKASKKKVKTKK